MSGKSRLVHCVYLPSTSLRSFTVYFFQINLIRESLEFCLDTLRIQSESIPLMRAVRMGYTKMVEVYNLDALKSISITRLQGHD